MPCILRPLKVESKPYLEPSEPYSEASVSRVFIFRHSRGPSRVRGSQRRRGWQGVACWRGCRGFSQGLGALERAPRSEAVCSGGGGGGRPALGPHQAPRPLDRIVSCEQKWLT